MDDGLRARDNGDRRAAARLRVLASGSSGNCTVLVFGEGAARRVWLIDLGLSPRRTTRLLDECGIAVEEVSDALLSHLDHDHCNPAWLRARGFRGTIRVHAEHWTAAKRCGLSRCEPIHEGFEAGGVRVTPCLTMHDELGTSALRFDFGCGAALGFATDLGRVTEDLVEHLGGVDVLAIESNYCPVMQANSLRPSFLKRRIMGGRGHLSNEEAAGAARAIGPGHVILLHLSRQCNRPETAASWHAGAPWRLTLTSQHAMSEWVEVLPGPRDGGSAVASHRQLNLFGAPAHALGAHG